MRRVLVVTATVCSLLWAVTGVSVLAIAFHEHHHHGDIHDHHDAVEVLAHGHDHDGSPDHDHELTAPMGASRSSWSGHLFSMVTQASELDDGEIWTDLDSARRLSELRGHGPPAFLMHCVLLT